MTVMSYTESKEKSPCCSLAIITKLCSTLCDPMICSPPGSSIHEISQAGILVWVAISFSRGSSRLRCVLNGQVDSFPLSRQGSSHLHCRISFTETLQLGLTLGMTLPSCLPQKTVPFIFKSSLNLISECPALTSSQDTSTEHFLTQLHTALGPIYIAVQILSTFWSKETTQPIVYLRIQTVALPAKPSWSFTLWRPCVCAHEFTVARVGGTLLQLRSSHHRTFLMPASAWGGAACQELF